MLKLIFPFLFIVLVEGGFFDLSDVEDPFAMLWNIPAVQKKFSECKIDNTRTGECMDKAKCLFTGGTPNGHCGIMFTCCSYEESCVKTSELKQSYFEVTNLSTAITNCKYTIKLRNKNVCQVRLDFETLILAPPVMKQWSTEGTNEMYNCFDDELKITPNNYGVPVLCGYNSNQHLYIHVNQSTDTDKAINIDINLASRLGDTTQAFPKPVWKIKFTQLECPVKKNKFDIFKFKDYDGIVNDFNALAPQGVIQYFTESRGQIRSFGFNPDITTVNVDSRYAFLEHYTIGFKRPSNVCGIKFTIETLDLLRSLDGLTCYHYLFIPEYFLPSVSLNQLSASTNTVTQLCTSTGEFFSFPPGPLYINFKAMKTEPKINTDYKGFQIDYELANTCPMIV